MRLPNGDFVDNPDSKTVGNVLVMSTFLFFRQKDCVVPASSTGTSNGDYIILSVNLNATLYGVWQFERLQRDSLDW